MTASGYKSPDPAIERQLAEWHDSQLEPEPARYRVLARTVKGAVLALFILWLTAIIAACAFFPLLIVFPPVLLLILLWIGLTVFAIRWVMNR
jgi:hypothetical protein